MSKLNLKQKINAIIVSAVFILIAAFVGIIKFYGDYLEINEIGSNFVSVYVKNITTNIVVYLTSAIVMFLIIYIQVIIVRICLEKSGVKQPILEKKRFVLPVCLTVSLFAAFFLNNQISTDFLLFSNSQSFNVNDPLFFKDVGFYVFTRPFIQIICESITFLWSIMLVLIVVLYASSYIKFGERTLIDLAKCRPIINHLAINVVLFMFIKAIELVFGASDLLFSEFSGYAGAGFVGANIWLNYYRLAPILMMIITVLVIVFVKRNMIKPALISFASYFVIYMLTFTISIAVDSIYVSPNESKVEEQYLKYHIEYTQKAYNIDDVVETEYMINNNFKASEVPNFSETINNIRIVDMDATLKATDQLQGLRSYYDFSDLDVAVYNVKNKDRAVILGVRELDKSKMDKQTSTYVNETFRYTHGYGAVMASINSVTNQGEPDYIIKDLTQQAQNGIPYISQPRIYFGETDNNPVVVNSKIREIDYSEGDTDYEFDYDGTAGVKLDFFNKLILSLRYADLKLIFSNQVTNESRMLLNKNIIKRVQKVAPFLKIDEDPHIVITNDGKLLWVVDAYTVTDKYPYSQLYEKSFNYIRNSVKITIDAYDGTTKFYIIDKTDPIINAYNAIYPLLFEKDELPEDIFNKTKYPEWLFVVQSKMYQRYHTKSPSTFYNKSDMFTVASEKYNNEIKEMKPYYNIMQLNEFNKDKAEMIFMLPYTLYNRENMVAWIAAGNSKDNYGKLVCYKYPKNYNVYGPLQIENMIDNDSEISKELTLWNSGGSTVIRGNILVIPVMGNILYIEPVYINSENQASIPVLKRMIAVFGDNIAMEETLENALKKVFAKDINNIYHENTEEDISQEIVDDNYISDDNIKKIVAAYEKIENAAKEGKWDVFGEGLNELKEVVEVINPEASDSENANDENLDDGIVTEENENTEEN